MIQETPKIEIFNTKILIRNYNNDDSIEFENFFKKYNKVTHSYEDHGIEYRNFTEEGMEVLLPGGFNRSYLKEWFNEFPHINESYDDYEKNLYIRLAYGPRDDVQKEAIDFIVGRNKYISISDNPQLCVNLNTGKGKTFVTIACSAYLGIKSIIILSSRDWMSQWKNCICEYTDTSPNEIYELAGVSSIALILHGKINLKNIKYFLASHQTIQSYGNKYGWDKVTELFKLIKVGIKIYDEAHLYFENIFKIDFYTNTHKTLYLTATPARSDRDEDRVYQAAFYECPKIDLFDEENDPRTHYVALKYNSHPTEIDINKCNNRRAQCFDVNAYCRYQVSNPVFYKILRIVLEEIFMRGKALIYVGLNDAILQIKDWIIFNYPWLRNQVGIYTSIIPKDKKVFEKEKMIILTTTKSAGAALDIKGLKVTVILSEIFKSQVMARQALGRTRDFDTLCIECVDVGFSAAIACYNSKLPTMQEYALDTEEVWLSDEDIDTRVNELLKVEEERIKNIYKSDNLRELVQMVDDNKANELIKEINSNVEGEN